MDTINKTKFKLEEQKSKSDIRIKDFENEIRLVKVKLNAAKKTSKNICDGKQKTKSGQVDIVKKTKLKCKGCNQSFKNTDDLNEHYQMELYCTTCDECIIGYYESNSENCIPDVEEHTTHEWRKIANKCTKCV